MENVTKQSTPKYIKALVWLISLSAFSLGFWHAHLGLREFNALSWKYGSLVLAGLILMVLIVTYDRAIAGVKYQIFFYLLCATFMFIFNLNSFYPNYVTPKLIKEDATNIKEIISKNKIILENNLPEKVKANQGSIKMKIDSLEQLKKTAIDELVGDGTIQGRGAEFNTALYSFNRIAGSNINLGTTKVILNPIEAVNIANKLSKRLDSAISNFYYNQAPGERDIYSLLKNKKALDSLNEKSLPELSLIEEKTILTVNVDSIKFQPDILKMKSIAAKYDEISKPVNEHFKKTLLVEMNHTKDQVNIPKSYEAGSIGHTISSIFERSNKIDTWGIIVLCFFIDFIVPFAMFLVLRKNDGQLKTVFSSKPETF